jgi:hypothetical protein
MKRHVSQCIATMWASNPDLPSTMWCSRDPIWFSQTKNLVGHRLDMRKLNFYGLKPIVSVDWCFVLCFVGLFTGISKSLLLFTCIGRSLYMSAASTAAASKDALLVDLLTGIRKSLYRSRKLFVLIIMCGNCGIAFKLAAGAISVSSYCYMCVLMMLYMCPRTTFSVSS